MRAVVFIAVFVIAQFTLWFNTISLIDKLELGMMENISKRRMISVIFWACFKRVVWRIFYDTLVCVIL